MGNQAYLDKIRSRTQCATRRGGPRCGTPPPRPGLSSFPEDPILELGLAANIFESCPLKLVILWRSPEAALQHRLWGAQRIPPKTALLSKRPKISCADNWGLGKTVRRLALQHSERKNGLNTKVKTNIRVKITRNINSTAQVRGGLKRRVAGARGRDVDLNEEQQQW